MSITRQTPSAVDGARRPGVARALVFDGPNILDATSRVLRDAGFEVAVAASGASALRVLQESELDLVVLDVTLPDAFGAVREVGLLRIDLPRHEVMLGERPVEITASEFRVLTLLAGSPGDVFTRRQIMEHVWDGPYFGDGHPADTHVLNLRRKLEVDPTRPRRLLTVRGVGFKLVAPPDETLI